MHAPDICYHPVSRLSRVEKFSLARTTSYSSFSFCFFFPSVFAFFPFSPSFFFFRRRAYPSPCFSLSLLFFRRYPRKRSRAPRGRPSIADLIASCGKAQRYATRAQRMEPVHSLCRGETAADSSEPLSRLLASRTDVLCTRMQIYRSVDHNIACMRVTFRCGLRVYVAAQTRIACNRAHVYACVRMFVLNVRTIQDKYSFATKISSFPDYV